MLHVDSESHLIVLFSGSLSNFGPSLRFCGFLLLVVQILINTVHGCSNSILGLNITYLK